VTDDLAFFPDRRRFNPYQTMLYGDLGRVGAQHRARSAACGSTLPRQPHPSARACSTCTGRRPSSGRRETPRGRAKVALIGDLLDAFQEAGGRLVWTVHTLLPDHPVRTVSIPHASYRGVYPDWVSRAGARRRLGVAPHESVVLALGQIRPGTGLDRLLDFTDRAGRPHLRLLVAERTATPARV
jgi:hypothetical protein